MFSLRLCSDLRRLPVGLVDREVPPVRHMAAAAAVELLGNVLVTSWAPTPIVLFGFHCLALFSKLSISGSSVSAVSAYTLSWNVRSSLKQYEALW